MKHKLSLIAAIITAALTLTVGTTATAKAAVTVPDIDQQAEYGATTADGLLTYTISANTITITDCSSAATEVAIPSEINGYSVVSIGKSAFESCDKLISVSIPDSVTTIGSCAFQNCSSLISVSIPDSVTTIGSRAFQNCSSLTSITIPGSLKRVYGHYREYEDSLSRRGWFEGCSSLREIIIQEGVTAIDDKAFANLPYLYKVVIPESVTEIGNAVFSGCFSMGTFTIPSSLQSILNNGAIKDTVLSGSYVTEIVLSDGISAIGDYAFSELYNLSKITIPDSVQEIGSGVFSNCSSLAEINLPNTVTIIGSSTFNGCSSLSKITMDSVTEIGSYAFANCSSLAEINLPDTVTIIGSSTFKGCSSLSKITMDSVTEIGSYAFANCSSLCNITVPDSVTRIYASAFSGCTDLTSIHLPAGITELSQSAFDDTVTDIYFGGSAEQWNSLNVEFPNATIYFDVTNEVPSNVTACADESKVVIQWDAVKTATSYRVFRADTPNGEKKLLKTVGTLKCTDTNVKSSETYYYFVAAYNSKIGLLSGYSEAVSATVPISITAPTLPAKPFYCLNDVITIKWNSVDSATSYRVYRANSLTGEKTHLKTTSLLRYTDQPKSGTYYYFIAAYNSKTDKLSDYSEAIKVSIITKPVIYTCEYLNNSVSLTWNTVNTATTYRVFRTDTETGVKKQIKTVSTNKCTDANIDIGKTYTYTVQAYNSKLRIVSASANPKTVTVAAFGAPKITSCSFTSSGTSITWTGVNNATSYRIYRAESKTGKKTLVKTTGILRYTDTTAEAGKTYYYFVAAYNSGTGDMSNYSEARAVNT